MGRADIHRLEGICRLRDREALDAGVLFSALRLIIFLQRSFWFVCFEWLVFLLWSGWWLVGRCLVLVFVP